MFTSSFFFFLHYVGEWSNDALLSFGLAEVPDTPSSLTDSGMKVISQLFPNIKTLSVSNCPHLMVMYQWMAEEGKLMHTFYILLLFMILANKFRMYRTLGIETFF